MDTFMFDERLVQVKSFCQKAEGAEYFILIHGNPALPFPAQLAALERDYETALREQDLSPASAVFRRVFLSDILNQQTQVRNTALVQNAAVSLIQQPPLSGAKIALLAYHVTGPLAKTVLSERHLLVERRGLAHLWSAELRGTPSLDAEHQTEEIFADLIAMLGRCGGTLEANCMRTWLYIKDVDVFYGGMVNARSALFTREGLTADTHFIASTGIEGAGADQFSLVTMDALSIMGLLPQQVSYPNDFSRLCRTSDYNVTFERATRIAWADRAHIYISGTASIDHHGTIVHENDVMRQVDRTVENIVALLEAGGATLADMMYMLVYVRDIADHVRVRERLAELGLGNLPSVIVQGAVCRPGWLVEIEGVAVTPHSDPTLPVF